MKSLHPIKIPCMLFMLCCHLCGAQVYAQNVPISGVVRNQQGTLLAGVTVKEKGSSNTVVTGENGRYTISVTGSGKTLVYSYVGFHPQEHAVSSDTKNLDVILEEDAAALDEVVIVGYQDVQRRKMTGAVSSVKGRDFENTPYATFDEMLQGRVAGLTVLSTSGEPGTNNIVNIRGSSNLGLSDNQLQAPLYVIDGIIYDVSDIRAAYGDASPLQAINPNDIESVDILKDASAASIYGARAANGVIIVKTKRPAFGTPEVRVAAYAGISSRPAMKPIMVGAADRRMKMSLLYAGGDYEWFYNGQIHQMLTDSLNPSFNNATDWQGLFLQSAPITNVNVSIGSATEKFLYRLSAQHYYEEGVMMGYANQSLTPRLLLQMNPIENLQFETNIFAGFTQSKHGSGDGSKYPFSTWGFPSSFWEIADLERQIYTGRYDGLLDEDRATSINGNVAGTIQKFFIPELSLRSQFSFNVNNNTRDLYRPALLTGNQNVAENWVNQNRRWEWESYFNYAKTLNEAHTMSGVLGFGMERNVANTNYLWGRNNNNEAIKTITGIASGPNLSGNSMIAERSRMSIFGRFGYDYKDKYLISASYRMDASSRYSADNRWGIFPSISAGWALSEEDFFKDLGSFVSYFKIRGSYGLTGRDPGSEYAHYTMLTYNGSYQGSVLDNGLTGNQFTYNGTNVVYPNYNDPATSAGIKWERSPQLNLGVDFNMLNDRIAINADYYIRDSENLVYGLQMPITSGFSTISTNFISVRNSGVEFTINSRNMSPRSPFQWSTNFNISYNRNYVTRLPYGGREIKVGPPWMERALNVGQPLYPFKVWKVEGVYSTNEDVPVNPLTGDRIRHGSSTGTQYQAGDPRRLDMNGDYVIDDNDKVDMGDPNPDFIGGMTHTFSYKNWSLSALTTFVFGRTLWNGYLSDRLQDAGAATLFSTWGPNSAISGDFNLTDFWMQPGDQAKFPTLFRNTVDNWHIANSTFVENASFIRLKNVRVGYNVPQAFSKRFGLSSLRLYAVMDNIAIISWSTVPDPEAVEPNGYSTGNGYPIPKKWTFGIDFTL
ncbi:SusC/RagA family TonB-linked outer membrane protein [Parapedobacter sp. ISTM3]|uniref:SusC/RagA family TonB-linked outer membrane protein n=1 Tax=Parapedobacter sp. ISTM3 TaxID=2800130 RepID=UPI001904D0E0|nr:SusC/RagA family TonB-linked outer membrane protein [Parapedobacter sp. ISTM3]MBK1438695.1 SusC/RagA family TonB-linked outer membrane protein [Parapedobacter sp. ISTM3]